MSLNDRAEGAQLLQPAARRPRAQVAARHGLGRARDVPERRGHHRRQCRGQQQGEHQRQREHHRRTAAASAGARQVERFRHGRDQDPVTAPAVIAIRRRVGQPRFARERLRRDVIEPELRLCGTADGPRTVSAPGRQSRFARPRRRRARTRRSSRPFVEDEGSAIRADGLAAQQRGARASRVLRRPFAKSTPRGSRRAACGCSTTPRDGALSPAAPHHRPRSAARRSPWRPPSTSSQGDERREEENPDRHAFAAPGLTSRGRRADAACQLHSLSPIARSLTLPGDLRPEPSEPPGERQGDQEGHRSQQPGDRQREEQRREDVSGRRWRR